MDPAEKLHQKLGQVLNRSRSPDTRALVNSMRKALIFFKGNASFDTWVEEALESLEADIPFSFEDDLVSKVAKEVELEPPSHIGPQDPGAPRIRRWVDKDGKPVVLNPADDFQGSDAESHYAAPALWRDIRGQEE